MKRTIVLLLLIGCWQPGCNSRAPEMASQPSPAATLEADPSEPSAQPATETIAESTTNLAEESATPTTEQKRQPDTERTSDVITAPPVDAAAPADNVSGLLTLELLGARLVKDESGTIRQVDLSGTNVRDDDLAQLQRVPSVEVLLLGGTGISDAGLTHLRDLSSLVFVDLSNTEVTDEGLAPLRDLPNLRALQLHGTQASSTPLDSWEGLQSPDALQWLTPSYAALRARGLGHDEETELRQREIHDYERILEKHPEQVELLYRLGTQRLALERLWDKQDLTGRRELLRSAILELQRLTKLMRESDPDAARMRAYHQLGRAWKHLGDFLLETGSDREKARKSYQAAVPQFREVLEIDPNQVDAMGEIVLVYLALDDRAAGLAAVQKHVSAAQSPRSRAKMYVMLGELFARNGEIEEAIKNLESALEADERAMDAYMVLFRLVAQRDGSESAIRLLRRAVETEPNFLNGHLQLGQLLVQQDKTDEAITSFESVLRVPPTEAVVLGMVPSPNVFRNRLYYQAAAWLAWLYQEARDDPERALQAVAVAKKFQPAEAHLLDTEGWIHVRLGDYQRGRDLLQQAAQQLDSPTTLYHLAQAQFELGQWAASERSVQQALDAGQSFPDRAAATKLLQRAREMLANQEDSSDP